MKPKMFNLKAALFFAALVCSFPAMAGGMKLSMNIDTPRYYSNYTLFTDLSKTGSRLFPYVLNSGEWTDKSITLGKENLNKNGYPKSIPFVSDGEEYGVRIIYQNLPGNYLLTYKGEGRIEFKGARNLSSNNNEATFSLDGKGRFFINIVESSENNPIRDFAIIPIDESGKKDMSFFNADYLKGLEAFDSLRFYKWNDCDVSTDKTWEDRVTAEHYTQEDQASIELAVKLANTLGKNAWFCVPYAADDTYIRNMAELVKKSLDPSLKIYIEYSNELWNFIFEGSRFVLDNGVSKSKPYLNMSANIQSDLKKIQKKYCKKGNCHPEKDAYMMVRAYKIWEEVFRDQRDRLVTVAAAQQTWPENTARMFRYFDAVDFEVDALAVGGYFKFENSMHDKWVDKSPGVVKDEDVLDAAEDYIRGRLKKNANKHGELARKYDVEYLIYEGGQHLQPYLQKEWNYNQAVYDSQIHPRIAELYQLNFDIHAAAGVDNFFAFSYIGKRESKWGSWGHITSLDELNSDLSKNAPKYQALMDYIANEEN